MITHKELSINILLNALLPDPLHHEVAIAAPRRSASLTGVCQQVVHR
jgi:hypothetical protein